MKNGDQGLWTIDELSDRVTEVLGSDYEGVPSGRVRDLPDLRTIRYYITLGLLDRPAEMRGRTALYGQRHLLQLVAIKHLQAQGFSLAEVQERLAVLSNSGLKKLAESRVHARSRLPQPGAGELAANDSAGSEWRTDSFWRLPTGQTARPQSRVAPEAMAAPKTAEPRELHKAAAETFEVPLSDGLVLALATRRGLDEDDLRSIRVAAAPLIEILRLRGLIDSDQG
jgi:DNA-binding transcriptional MerR regulator